MNDDLKVLGFLDVLGFKSKFREVGLDEMYARYSKITEYVREQTGGLDIVPTPDGHVAIGWLEIGHAYFSDTILFWTKYNKMSLPSFIELMSEAVCFSIEQGLPLRGTISVGEAIFDSDTHTYLGEPIIEGAETEATQRWIGVSFGSSFLEGEFSQGFHLHTVLPYESHYKGRKPAWQTKAREFIRWVCPAVPSWVLEMWDTLYKDNEINLATGMVVDWPRKWRETRKSDVRPIIQALDTLPEAHAYYENTLKFVDFSEENHDWFKNGGHLSYG